MTAPVQLPAGRAPARVGQATAIEQSRAIAEVQAAVLVAMNYPRDQQAAIRAMRDTCSNPRLAAAAFFAFPRGEERVSGPSVHLARELARIWGNISHGVAEMVRDDEHGQSEMQAYAWDLETNTRVATTFIVPHKRDTRLGVKDLVDMRDIYENNANNGARRVRECIFAVLPRWYSDEAQELCAKTNEHGGGRPLQQRIAAAIEAYATLGVSEEQLVERLGRVTSRWTGQDLAQLQTLHSSLQRGEVDRDVEFPRPAAVTPDQLGPAPAVTPPAPEPAPAARPPAHPRPITQAQQRKLHASFNDLGLAGDARRDDKLAVLASVTDRPIGSSSDLSQDEARIAIDTLDGVTKQGSEEGQLVLADLINAGREVQSRGSQ
jgi:hypothetical protein